MFQFAKSNCVIVGTFNNHIINPKWLINIGLFERDSEVRYQTNLNQPESRFQVEDDPVRWTVRPDKLLIESTASGSDCGAMAAEVLEALPWTPVRAVGTNTEFEAELTDDVLMFANRYGLATDRYEIEGYDQRQMTTHLALSSEQKIFNFQLALSDVLLRLSINIHTEINQKKTQQEQIRTAINSCSGFIHDRNEAIQLVNRVFECEIVL